MFSGILNYSPLHLFTAAGTSLEGIHIAYIYRRKERWLNPCSTSNESLSQPKACLLCADLWAVKCQETEALFLLLLGILLWLIWNIGGRQWKISHAENLYKCKFWHDILCITSSSSVQFWQAIRIPHLTLKAWPNVAAWMPFIWTVNQFHTVA